MHPTWVGGGGVGGVYPRAWQAPESIMSGHPHGKKDQKTASSSPPGPSPPPPARRYSVSRGWGKRCDGGVMVV